MDSSVHSLSTSPEDKTVAIISYLTFIGFIVAVILHSNNKTTIGTYHLRQALNLLLSGVALGIVGVVPVIGWIAMPIIAIGLLVLWVLGLISAIKGEMKPIPLLGVHFQTWFAGAFG